MIISFPSPLRKSKHASVKNTNAENTVRTAAVILPLYFLRKQISKEKKLMHSTSRAERKTHISIGFTVLF